MVAGCGAARNRDADASMPRWTDGYAIGGVFQAAQGCGESVHSYR